MDIEDLYELNDILMEFASRHHYFDGLTADDIDNRLNEATEIAFDKLKGYK